MSEHSRGLTKWLFVGTLIASAVVTQPTHAQSCYVSSVVSPTPFMGNNGEIFRLADGSIWEVKYEYEYLYEYYPTVVVCPSAGTLVINGKKLNIAVVASGRSAAPAPQTGADVIETRIDGEFEGWEGDTIFKMMNGQIWQQTSYAYKYSYKYSPQVIIFRTGRGYEMQVEGISDRIRVTRLK